MRPSLPRLGRQPVTAPDNAGAETIAVFGTDPHGAAMFAGVTNGTLGHLGARPVLDASHGSWHGWTAAPQGFRGAGNLGAGRPVIVPTTRLDQSTGLAPDNVQALFGERMASRRFE